MSRRPQIFLVGAALAALTLPAAAQDGATDPDTVVATVDGTEITLGHMIALRERLPQQYDQLPADALFAGVLDQLVQQQALAGQVETPPRGVELSLDNERRALLSNAALADTLEQAVSEEAIRAAYEETYGDAAPRTEYNADHILVETEEEAREIVAELEAGASFATLAQERSADPSASQGGSLGWFGAGVMVPAFEEAVTALSPGETSDPVETQFGWHVVRLNDTREQTPPELADVRDQIAQQLRSEAVSDAVAEAVEAADVERSDTSGIDPSALDQPDLID